MVGLYAMDGDVWGYVYEISDPLMFSASVLPHASIDTGCRRGIATAYTNNRHYRTVSASDEMKKVLDLCHSKAV